ncbi:hypothetical protein GCM10011316_14180 [Roseibium aquae]|uniref:Uncharacterized protein n=1 Tax=Roseibium aquae TaxID=1323746 RepID=A0A916TFW2_9HYPH|nr:hypothetical protein [Roseibium aquae]GGB43343.1 hypothetical protein GCM10011316_14180 [Roseibium aquae]
MTTTFWPTFAVPVQLRTGSKRTDRLNDLENRMNAFLAEKERTGCAEVVDRVKASREEVRNARSRP